MTKHILNTEAKPLLKLFQTLDKINELTLIFEQYVTKSMAMHCKIATIKNDCLIVIVDNGNWATQLRFHIPDLLSKLRLHAPFKNLKAICCKTRPISSKQEKNSQHKQQSCFSKETATLILASAEKIKDKKIRTILEKIATKHSNSR